MDQIAQISVNTQAQTGGASEPVQEQPISLSTPAQVPGSTPILPAIEPAPTSGNIQGNAQPAPKKKTKIILGALIGIAVITGAVFVLMGKTSLYKGAMPSSPEVSTVEITPATATVLVEQTKEFRARALDSAGNPVANIQFKWQSLDRDIGTINSSGLFTAKAAGSGSIRATASDTANTKGDATVTVTAAPAEPAEPPPPPPPPTPPPSPPPSPEIQQLCEEMHGTWTDNACSFTDKESPVSDINQLREIKEFMEACDGIGGDRAWQVNTHACNINGEFYTTMESLEGAEFQATCGTLPHTTWESSACTIFGRSCADQQALDRALTEFRTRCEALERTVNPDTLACVKEGQADITTFEGLTAAEAPPGDGGGTPPAPGDQTPEQANDLQTRANELLTQLTNQYFSEDPKSLMGIATATTEAKDEAKEANTVASTNNYAAKAEEKIEDANEIARQLRALADHIIEILNTITNPDITIQETKNDRISNTNVIKNEITVVLTQITQAAQEARAIATAKAAVEEIENLVRTAPNEAANAENAKTKTVDAATKANDAKAAGNAKAAQEFAKEARAEATKARTAANNAKAHTDDIKNKYDDIIQDNLNPAFKDKLEVAINSVRNTAASAEDFAVQAETAAAEVAALAGDITCAPPTPVKYENQCYEQAQLCNQLLAKITAEFDPGTEEEKTNMKQALPAALATLKAESGCEITVAQITREQPPTDEKDAQIKAFEDRLAALQTQLENAQRNNNNSQIDALTAQIAALAGQIGNQGGQTPNIVINLPENQRGAAPEPAPTVCADPTYKFDAARKVCVPPTEVVIAPADSGGGGGGSGSAAAPATKTEKKKAAKTAGKSKKTETAAGKSKTVAAAAEAEEIVIPEAETTAQAAAKTGAGAGRTAARASALTASERAAADSAAASAAGQTSASAASAAAGSAAGGSQAASAAAAAAARKTHGSYIQGQTGPGILLYPVGILIANCAYYATRRRKKN